MIVRPDFEAFAAAYGAGMPQVLWATLISDLETPVSATLKLTDGQRYSFLLESVQGGAFRGRYSIIGLKPDLIWRCRGGHAEINRRASAAIEDFERLGGKPLETLRALVRESRISLPPHLPPMASGLFGYLGYDMVRQMERLPDKNPDALGIPEAVMIRPTLVAVFDTIEDVVTVITPVWPRQDIGARAAFDAGCARLADALADLGRSLPHHRAPRRSALTLPEPTSTFTRPAYHQAVLKAKEYIAAGDAFQVVPSQRFSVPFRLPSTALYRALRRLNPSPFLFHLALDDMAIVGSSPEILVRLRDGIVTIRPIAGTRRRGATPAEDAALADELLGDPKERAEHLMLLDLGRNDVGRVAEIGSVRVTEQFVIERYSHVMHIASHVEGKLRDGLDAIDALVAGFPAGTVSGAPKVRAMEIIDELEPVRRGVYAGAVGYFAANGAMDTCIALRTAVLKDGMMHVQAGGGVVHDSDPDAEYVETVNKARALFRAAEEAIRFAEAG
ncbi:MAG: anthranilate synthase component I [Alphaproteobacteria bacterium]|nr:anthranilate synthase component I [Alphaproteobacteria bacterium]